MTGTIGKRRPHYAFFVFAACCSFTGISVALYFSCSGIFYTPVSEYFGVGRGTYAISGTIMSITLGLFSPIMGRLIEKYSLRRLLIICLILQASSYIAQSMFTNIYYFYISGAAHGIVHSLMMILLVPAIINRWFDTKRGFFIGLASSMSGVGGIILNAVAGPFMDAFGWQDTFLLYGILIALIPLPLAVFVLRDYPSEKNLLPYGYQAENIHNNLVQDIPIDDSKKQGVSYETAKKSLAFWMLATISVLTGFVTCYTSYLPSYATSLGMSITFGAGLASFMGFGILIGKNTTGILLDKSPSLGLFVSTLMPAFGFTLLYLFGITAPGAMPIGSVLYGVSYSITPVLLPLLVMFIFGAKDHSRILGSISFYGNLFSAAATVAFGYISDLPDGIGFIIIILIGSASSVGNYLCGSIALHSGKKYYARG